MSLIVVLAREVCLSVSVCVCVAERKLYIIASFGVFVRSAEVVRVCVSTRGCAFSQDNFLVHFTDYSFDLSSEATHSSSKLKHTCITDRARHGYEAQTRSPTLTDGLRDASTIKLIHLKSLTITS